MASSRVTSLPRKKLTTLDFSAHACISVNSTNRDLVAFIDGKNMHHGPVDKEDKKIELRDRVLLGATWLREKQYFQSEPSVGNVNVYDKILHPMTMKKITETGMFLVHCCPLSLWYLDAETGYRVATPYTRVLEINEALGAKIDQSGSFFLKNVFIIYMTKL